jgi:hypothetical protein
MVSPPTGDLADGGTARMYLPQSHDIAYERFQQGQSIPSLPGARNDARLLFKWAGAFF